MLVSLREQFGVLVGDLRWNLGCLVDLLRDGISLRYLWMEILEFPIVIIFFTKYLQFT